MAILWGMLKYDELPLPKKSLIRLYTMKEIETIIEMDIELEAEVPGYTQAVADYSGLSG